MKSSEKLQTLIGYSLISILVLFTFCFAAATVGEVNNLSVVPTYIHSVASASLALIVFWLVGWAAQFFLVFIGKVPGKKVIQSILFGFNFTISIIAMILAANVAGIFNNIKAGGDSAVIHVMVCLTISFIFFTIPLTLWMVSTLRFGDLEFAKTDFKPEEHHEENKSGGEQTESAQPRKIHFKKFPFAKKDDEDDGQTQDISLKQNQNLDADQKITPSEVIQSQQSKNDDETWEFSPSSFSRSFSKWTAEDNQTDEQTNTEPTSFEPLAETNGEPADQEEIKPEDNGSDEVNQSVQIAPESSVLDEYDGKVDQDEESNSETDQSDTSAEKSNDQEEPNEEKTFGDKFEHLAPEPHNNEQENEVKDSDRKQDVDKEPNSKISSGKKFNRTKEFKIKNLDDLEF